ncbi:sugar transferase [Flavobacteriaceae bacterium]|nr:sugar transferase [Flavobacteriaceae bacterium]MDB4280321.1 sugar transferase [Flavobacteriaceae bacterium]MDB9912394.1 sugar transferase [Flavobacteriaceae bacterium]
MYRVVKRILDFVVSLIGFILLSPLFFITWLLVKTQTRGSVFFVQSRPGKNEKIFNIVKFKSMTDAKDLSGKLLSNKDRITSIGRFIRRTSLDEIPQLLNVLKGDMSFVGPRPLLPAYLSLYSDSQKKRHWVKPGITGWAQVNGRNAISHTKKFELDVWYVEHQSLLLDIKILLLTVKKVFKKDGIGALGFNEGKAFDGTN